MRVKIPRTRLVMTATGSVALTLVMAACGTAASSAGSSSAGTPTVSVSKTMAPEPTVSSLTSGCAKLPVVNAKIGVMVPLGGAFASDTQQVVNAAKMALSGLNGAGGVCGKKARYKFGVVVGNTDNEESSAVIAAAQLLNTTAGLNFVMTSYASTSNFEIKLMAKDQMPYLLSANSAQTAAIISKDPSAYPTVWSRVPSYNAYSTQLPVILNGLEKAGRIKFKHGKTVYIISSNDPYGSTIAQGLKTSFTADGWKVIGFDTVPYGQVTNWQTNLAHIKQNVPDVIVNTDAAAADDATFTDQFVASPTSSLVFLQYGPSVPQYLQLTGAKANGVLYNMLGGAIPTLASTKQITAEYEAKYGVPGYFAVVAYNQVMLYAHCVKQVGDPTNRLAIGACLGSLNIMTPSGPLRFDQTTHLAEQGSGRMPILFYQIQNQQHDVISPTQYAATTFKAPPWLMGGAA